ncbi:CocE/NonD family hydrolase [Rhodococcus sp. LB1]|uniref:CocE/NonD family hydrolase n=1 Tax=Rhodococcus sp. LB1 TaxID=1807499 RepID=UPI00077AB1A5|nr:CocE/NonD family hydrolase [Rhodococcus sp. LB1]KXX60337.1 hypothetical protein AZG88_38150 [Rhodococcus sp. LB1]
MNEPEEPYIVRRSLTFQSGSLIATLAVAAAAATGCTSAETSESDGSPAHSDSSKLVDAPAPAAVQDWLNYDRPGDFDSIETQVQVPTRDGTELACTRFQPGREGVPDTQDQHPGLILNFMPYYKDSYTGQHAYFAERGYDVLTCDVRGAGNSPGEYPGWFQAKESEDNYDIIEWLAAQPNSNGRIGQMGSSYGSITSYRAAALKPPHLTTIVPIVSPTNIYSEWVYPGGVPSTVGSWWANEGPVLDTAAHTRVLSDFQQHPQFDDYWKQIVTTNKLQDVSIPALHIGGYFDIFKNGGFDALAQRADQTWLLYGPWTHKPIISVAGAEENEENANTITTGTVLQWFDRWLAERPEADLPPTRVTSYESNSTDHSGEWRSLDQWPANSTDVLRLYPTGGGQLTESIPPPADTQYAVNPYDGPSEMETGTMPWAESQDQAQSETAKANELGRYSLGYPRTTFTLPAFEKDTTVAGPVALHVSASITAPDTYFVSKLEVVTADGRVLPIEAGYLRAQLRESFERVVPVTPGEPTQYRIDLGHTHWRFTAGEQLRVTLSGGDIPKVNPTAPAGVVTIHHGDKTYVDVTTHND